ncbi:hypothetical protein J2Y69_000366 [Microbacterium resistens]|uniref:Peptidoglycan binding-like domain-containing protein n=1 Tax=Microbacterium resistens TaxID=156977 RepID=A0ABU1S864_9MICO|nr:peptidoglycan-binding domain-containing protein [Microbacterium resistens]MDR6865784.1 hypothetical protein [Microbacterium resistens]
MGRVTRTPVAIGIGAVCAAIVIAALCAALLIMTGVQNFQTTQKSPEEAPPVLATVELGSVERLVSVGVHTSPSFSLEIPSSQFGAGVVTSAALGKNAVLNEGDMLVAIDEKPVMIIQGETPAYRSLSGGMEGSDVRQLQDYLRDRDYSIYDDDGVFGPSTALALSELYESRGEPLITSTGVQTLNWEEAGLPLSRYVFVASTPVVVGTQCGRLGQLADTLKCTLISQATTIAISDTSGQALTGLTVTIRTKEGAELSGTVGDSITPFVRNEDPESEEPKEETESWYSLLDLPEEGVAGLPDSAQVLVEATSPEGFRVPATAVRESDNGKSFLREKPSDRNSSAPDIPVRVDMCSGGYCAVSGDGLIAGMQVVLLG